MEVIRKDMDIVGEDRGGWLAVVTPEEGSGERRVEILPTKKKASASYATPSSPMDKPNAL